MFLAPTADELLQNRNVQQALCEAWENSLPEDPGLRHEEGGWILMNPWSREITVAWAESGSHHEIDLTPPASLSRTILVGKFHTHPNPTSAGWEPRPSLADSMIDWQHGVPDLIVSDQGVFISGPSCRQFRFNEVAAAA